jgi:hypothetical protein
MDPRKAKFTQIFIWICFTIIIGVDIALAVNGVSGDTISAVTKAYSFQWAIIPMSYGILTGHLFWPIRGKIEFRWLRTVGLGMAVMGIILFDVLGHYDVFPIIVVAIGVPLGRLLWPQSVPLGTKLFART